MNLKSRRIELHLRFQPSGFLSGVRCIQTTQGVKKWGPNPAFQSPQSSPADLRAVQCRYGRQNSVCRGACEYLCVVSVLLCWYHDGGHHVAGASSLFPSLQTRTLIGFIFCLPCAPAGSVSLRSMYGTDKPPPQFLDLHQSHPAPFGPYQTSKISTFATAQPVQNAAECLEASRNLLCD